VIEQSAFARLCDFLAGSMKKFNADSLVGELKSVGVAPESVGGPNALRELSRIKRERAIKEKEKAKRELLLKLKERFDEKIIQSSPMGEDLTFGIFPAGRKVPRARDSDGEYKND